MAYGIVVKRVKNNLPRTRNSGRNTEPSEGRLESRIKVSAQQYYEKYSTLARESMATGDRVAAEGYYQHAEHYLRMLSDVQPIAAVEEAPEPFWPSNSSILSSEIMPYTAGMRPQMEEEPDFTN